MLLILAVVIGLVAWALHLMQCAVDRREFSLMLAGLLVSSAAAGLVGVYFLTSNCVSYMTSLPQSFDYSEQLLDIEDWDRELISSSSNTREYAQAED